MNESNHPPVSFSRILVAVDASPHSQAALEAAVDMASRFHAELIVLFVEDINVFRAAELPFAREVGQYSARRRGLEIERIERRLRSRSRAIREQFQALILRESVQGTFRVARGVIRQEIQMAAQEADILIVGRAGWSEIRQLRLGSTARAACCDEIPGVTAVLHEGKPIVPPILVVFDGSVIGEHALMLGADLVERLAGPLRVLLLAAGVDKLAALRDQANERLRSYNVMRQYQGLVASSVGRLAAAIRESLNDGRAFSERGIQHRPVERGTLVLPATSSLFEDDALLDLIEEVDIPVLLVR